MVREMLGQSAVPPARMKGGREHRVPLSATALAVLARMRQEGHFVFPSSRLGPSIHPNTALELAKQLGGATVHGFRSSFRDWSAETTSFPREACELALAHTIPNRIEAAYRRGD
jgi:integrase